MSSLEMLLFEEIFLMNSDEIDKNFQYLGEGAGRIIYALDDDYVIKMSKFAGGDKQCKTEHYIYNHVQDHLKKYLCPVVWYKDDILIMRRAVPLAKKREERKQNVFNVLGIREDNIFYKNIQQLVQSFDLLYGDVKNLSSWGLIDNQVVLIDYGCTNKIYRKYFTKK
ncbi:hypothetical protein N4T77_02270 [Clostridium sp. CX1]|uniref:Protein kinase domain-containing protein n=1 Tax=Clostridium tanneri TaxID=3037988 RepID=A0ABU4JT61_9CLOT|nr:MULTISPECIES: hypothetical protein [unclassified Clostridium]MCT8975415.1 hypothetical protein [Clostridium sp. CX1]MDW8801354.1 hypothetical protein [Clostridium sp. A1-XYC3]